MNVKIAVENTVDDALTEHLALVSDTNAALLRELAQHAMFTESLPEYTTDMSSTTLQEYMQIMLCTLERLNVGEDAVKARELWSGLLTLDSDVLGYCSYRLVRIPKRSDIFVLKSNLGPLAHKELDKDVAVKATPLLNLIESGIGEYSKIENPKEKAEYSDLYTLSTILHAHLDGMTLRIWHMSSSEIGSWLNMSIAYLKDCMYTIQYNDLKESHVNSKAETFIAGGRVVEELPVTLEAQRLLGAACDWWRSKLLEWIKPYEPHPKLVDVYSMRENLSLLKLTEVYCATQEYNEEWALALLL